MNARPLRPITPEIAAAQDAQIDALRDHVLRECFRWACYRQRGLIYDPETRRIVSVSLPAPPSRGACDDVEQSPVDTQDQRRADPRPPQPAGKGKPRKAVGVPSHRLVPIDRSRYPGHALRLIRGSKTNFLGEIRR